MAFLCTSAESGILRMKQKDCIDTNFVTYNVVISVLFTFFDFILRKSFVKAVI